MSDIDRRPNSQSIQRVHTHICPKCTRPYSCACHVNEGKEKLICIDCERAGTSEPLARKGASVEAGVD